MSFPSYTNDLLTKVNFPLSPAITKDRVCVTFYESGKCPFSDRCEHAHSFNELSAETQSKLLNSVPAGSIPAHFMGSRRCPASPLDDMSSDTSGAHGSGSRYTRRHGAGAETGAAAGPSTRRLQLRSKTLHDSLSTCSQVSSADGSPLSRGAFKSATAQPLDHFQMRLPARCHYPHRNILGTYYDVLGLPQTATQEEIINKYQCWRLEGFKHMRLVDNANAESVDRLVVEARNVLGEPCLRAEYDRLLPLDTSSCGKMQPATFYSANTSLSQRQTQGQSSAASTSSDQAPYVDYNVTKFSDLGFADLTSPLTGKVFASDIW